MKITIKVKGYDKKKLLEDIAKAIELMQAHEAEHEPTLADLPVIDWVNAPKDAVCHSNDKNGGGFFYAEAATLKADTWTGKPWNDPSVSGSSGVDMPPFSGDGWKQTLQMRPEPEAEEVEAFEWKKGEYTHDCYFGECHACISIGSFIWRVLTADEGMRFAEGFCESMHEAKANAEVFMLLVKEQGEKA